MPSSSSTSAFARRARRCAADPSRANSIRSCRDSLSRKPGRIMRSVESSPCRFARGGTRIFNESGYTEVWPKNSFDTYTRVPSSTTSIKMIYCSAIQEGGGQLHPCVGRIAIGQPAVCASPPEVEVYGFEPVTAPHPAPWPNPPKDPAHYWIAAHWYNGSKDQVTHIRIGVFYK
jgi:hypothetical protein